MGCRVVCFFAALLTFAMVGDVQAQCEGISVVQDGLFIVITHDVEYNCAVTSLTHQVTLEGSILHVVELALAQEWALCYCPYTSTIEVGGLPAGEYTLDFEYSETIEGEDPASWTWCEVPFEVTSQIVVPPEEIMVAVGVSGCGIVTAVPDGPLEREMAWATVKGLFR